MQKLILAFLVVSIVSCSSEKKWTKEYVAEKCNKDFKQRNEKDKVLDSVQIVSICDCIADKMVTKYKSEAEADKDAAAASQVGTDCAMSVMSPSTPQGDTVPADVNVPVDTTQHADTSNH